MADDFLKYRKQYGPVDKLATRHFLIGPYIGEDFEVREYVVCFKMAKRLVQTRSHITLLGPPDLYTSWCQ